MNEDKMRKDIESITGEQAEILAATAFNLMRELQKGYSKLLDKKMDPNQFIMGHLADSARVYNEMFLGCFKLACRRAMDDIVTPEELDKVDKILKDIENKEKGN